MSGCSWRTCQLAGSFLIGLDNLNDTRRVGVLDGRIGEVRPDAAVIMCLDIYRTASDQHMNIIVPLRRSGELLPL